MVTIHAIIAATAGHFQLTPDDLVGKRRTGPIAHARMVAMHLARQHTPFSLTQIGIAFGGRNHATVLHADRCIPFRATSNPKLAEALSTLQNQLNNPTPT